MSEDDQENSLRRLVLRKAGSCLSRENRIAAYEDELAYLGRRRTIVLRRIRKLKESPSNDQTT